MMRVPITLLCLIVALNLIGCDNTSQPDYSKLGLVDISGKVTLDGEPISNVAVFFHDRDNRRYSWGVTDQNGNYQLMFDSRKSGILPGLKEIEITSSRDPSSSPADTDEGFVEGNDADAPKSPSSGETIPAKYNKKSKLTYEVVDSASDVNFDLVSD